MAISLVQHRKFVTSASIAKFSDDNTPGLGLSAFFPAVTTNTEEVSIEVQRNLALIAVDVQRCTDPNRNIFSKSTEKLIKPAFYSESFDITSCEGYNITFGSGSAPNAAYATMLIDTTTKNTLALKNKIARAIEKQRASVLQTGIVVLKNGDSIDYRRQSQSMVTLTGGDTWDNASAPIYNQLAVGVKFIRRQGMSTRKGTMNLILGSNALGYLFANTELQNRAKFFNQINLVDIHMPQMDEVSGMTLHGQVSVGDAKINLWTYDGWYQNPDGTTTDYIDADNAILLSMDFEGKTGFGGVPAVFNPNTENQYIAPMEGDFVIHDLIDPKRRTWEMIVESAPVAVPVSVDRIFSWKVK